MKNVSRKILAPPLPPTLLYREQLSRVLAEALGSRDDTDVSALYHLVLLCAPAGYGKTTLLADTVKRLSLTCCWFFLDHSDQKCVTFLEMFIASIRRRFPSFGPQLDNLLTESIEQDETALQTFLSALIAALTTDLPEHTVLAFCNYQEVNSSRVINNIVNQLLKRLPSQCLLVIESRALPDLNLAPLIAGRKMFGLGSNSLRFSAQDLRDLAQVQNLPTCSEEEAIQLATTFDGWIAGILLGSRFGSAQFEQSMFASRSNWAAPTMYTNRQQLFAYIVKDVFGHDAAIYTFLKETSLLDQMVPSFCDAFLETSNAAMLLESAQRQGLFVICTGETEEPVYRCHPILRELFQEELRRHEGERYRTLHKRIATLFYQKHEYQVALDHALEAQEYDLATTILLEAAPTLFNQGHSETVLRSLERFPSHLAKKNPQLLLLQVNTYLRRGDFANARLFFDIAQDLGMTSPPTNGNANDTPLRAEFVIAHGKLLLYQGEHQLAQQRFRQALEWLPVDERVLRIYAHQHLGICIILGGDPISEGIVQFQQALQLCHPRIDEHLAGELHHQLASAYEWSGNYTIAEHHRQCIRVLQDRLGQPQSIINNLTGLGLLKMRQGFVGEAETFFQNILRLTQQSARFLSSRAYALLGFGELEMTRQCFQQALTYLEEALSLARQLEDRYLLNGTLNTLALVYLRMGDIHTAQCLLDQTVLRANETRSYDAVSHTLISGTILLAQQHCDQAKTALEEVVRLTGETAIHWLRIQALMRLAACYMLQGQATQAKKALRQVIALNIKGNYDYCMQVELQAYPTVQPLIQEASEQNEDLDQKILPAVRLSIQALGEPLVLIDANPVTHWRMARAMELYFFLLEHRQPLRKDQIIAALWPNAEDIEHINQTFRSTTYYLRQVIGDACLVQRSGQYRLDLTAVYGQFWYDVAIFEEQQHTAMLALEAKDEERAIQALQKMVDLYRGDYVQAFYSDWCIARRDELRTACMKAHQQLALIAWRREAYDKSLLHWQHLLTLDPYLEEAHYGVMRCYMRQGKRNLALRQYQRCSQDLHEQLQIKPGPSLQKLYQRLTSSQE